MRSLDEKLGNLYLDTLEYGEKQLIKRQAVTSKQLQEYLEDKGYKFLTNEEKQLLRDLGREAFFIYVGDSPKIKYYLNIEGYFKLLDYRELNDARQSSKSARRYSMWAISIAIVTLVMSIIFSSFKFSKIVRA